MRRFGMLLASAALGAALAASGPAFGRMGGGGFGGGHMGGGFGGHFNAFGPRFTGRSVAIGRFDRRFFNRNDRFRRFGRFNRDDRFFFRRGFFASGFPFWGWGGGWGYPYGYNAYSGNNYPGADYSYSTAAAGAPLMIGASVAPGEPCIISVKACQRQKPPFVGSDCSCKVPATSEVP